MRFAILAFCLGLTGCVTGPALDPALPIGPPSKFNAEPDRYDRQQVYVQGYLETRGHWWQFNFYENGKQFAGNFCLNLENIEWAACRAERGVSQRRLGRRTGWMRPKRQWSFHRRGFSEEALPIPRSVVGILNYIVTARAISSRMITLQPFTPFSDVGKITEIFHHKG